MALSRYSSPSPQRAAVGVRFTDAERYFVSEASVYADAKHKLIRKPSKAPRGDRLPGWAYRICNRRIRPRGLPDWICVTTWPEVGANPAAETVRVRAA